MYLLPESGNISADTISEQMITELFSQ